MWEICSPQGRPAHQLGAAMLMRSESLQSTFVFNDFCVVRFRVVEKPTEQALVSWSRAVGPPAAHESFAIPASAAAAAYNQKRYVMDLARWPCFQGLSMPLSV